MLESILSQIAEKYRPQIEALEQQLASDDGLSFTPYQPLTKEQHESLLFGRFFGGLDQPLIGLEISTYKQVPSQRAFVNHLRVKAYMGCERYLAITGL